MDGEFKVVALTLYGGVGEIGGNKVLLEDGDTRVFFDFGESFTMGGDFFTGWLCPRRVEGLRDYFAFGLLPKLVGLYSKDQLRFTDVPHGEPDFTAVFLSHAHFDHINHIQFLDPRIPVHLGTGTKLFIEAMEKTGTSCNYKKHPYHTFRTGDTIKVGEITVEPIHVDHSIPAAYGFLIHTSKGTVVYTGDLRAHGPRKDMTHEFADKAQASEPVAMVCEGTRMVEKRRRKNHSEGQVEQLSNEIASSAGKAVFVTHYSRDMDRFRSFYTVAKTAGRRFVISPKTAYLLERLQDDTRLDLPDPLKDENILVYYRRKKTGEYDAADYFVWERGFMEKMATPEFVREHQRELIMDLGFYQFAELVDIKPERGSHFIHSMSEPRTEEDLEDHVMHNWLSHFGIYFHQIHASGHMNRRELGNLIDFVKPKTLIPVHTDAPHLFRKTGAKVHLAQLGKRLVIP